MRPSRKNPASNRSGRGPGMAGWADFLEKQAGRRPLEFVHGLIHSVAPGQACALHAHSSLEIIYHPTGKGVTTVENHALEFDEGSVVIHPPGQQHDQLMEQAGEDFCVKIATPGRGISFPKECLFLSSVHQAALIEDLRLLAQVNTTPNPREQAVLNLRATTVLLSLIEMACRRQNRQEADRAERHVMKAEEYLRKNFASVNSLREAAEAVDLSPDYLRHQFKRLRGRSLIAHLTALRVERAKTLLMHSALPLKAIATLCGFRDEYYFSRVFHRQAHVTPGRYRAAQREDASDLANTPLTPHSRKAVTTAPAGG